MYLKKIAFVIGKTLAWIIVFQYHALAVSANKILYPRFSPENVFVSEVCKLSEKERAALVACLQNETLNGSVLINTVNYNEVEEAKDNRQLKNAPGYRVFPDHSERAAYLLGTIEAAAHCKEGNREKALLLFSIAARYPNAAFSAGLMRLRAGELQPAYENFLQSAAQGGELAMIYAKETEKILIKRDASAIDFRDQALVFEFWQKSEYLIAVEKKMKENNGSTFCFAKERPKASEKKNVLSPICGICL